MQIGFERFDRDWILPVDGTLGNKAQNLFTHREAIRTAGFKRPEAIVVPWEYIKAMSNAADFVLSVIDKWLPGWTKIYVRSNAPDEDADRRIPGLYSTELIWHEDRAKAPQSIDKVIESYDLVRSRRSRKMRGISGTGMGILLEPAVIDEEPGLMNDTDYAGSYTQCGDFSKVLFAHPEYMHKAMTQPPWKSYVVTKGRIQADHTPEQGEIVHRLEGLVARLPKIEGKGWEIEFISHDGEMYAAQVTPLVKHSPVLVPGGVESLFEVSEVIGTGDYSLNGLLMLPPLTNACNLEVFDTSHLDYAVFTTSLAVRRATYQHHFPGEPFMLLNARVFIIEEDGLSAENLSPHVEQYIRNTGIALRVKSALGPPPRPMYSSTPHRVIADEASGKGVVLLEEPLKPFERLKA